MTASAYTKETCTECQSEVMAQGGIVVDHVVRGSGVMCEGSREPSVEEEDRRLGVEEVDDGESGEPVAITIERGIPVPKVKPGYRGRYEPTLRAMEVGDSFAVPDDEGRAVEAAVRNSAKKLGIKVTCRRLENGDIRTWRIE